MRRYQLRGARGKTLVGMFDCLNVEARRVNDGVGRSSELNPCSNMHVGTYYSWLCIMHDRPFFSIFYAPIFQLSPRVLHPPEIHF